jgi:hypothetical protein
MPPLSYTQIIYNQGYMYYIYIRLASLEKKKEQIDPLCWVVSQMVQFPFLRAS